MNILIFIVTYWDVLLTLLILLVGTIFKLKRLWKGNFVEWLIAICDEIEKEFGAGGGLLKHANAYAKFVEKYPIISKFISQETFDKWVKEALAELDTLEKAPVKEVEIPDVIEEPVINYPVAPVAPQPTIKEEIKIVENVKEENNETIVEIKEKSMNITLPNSEVPMLKLEKIDSTKINKLKILSPKQATLELAVSFDKEDTEKKECDVQISSTL